jgi:hypothetical protein
MSIKSDVEIAIDKILVEKLKVALEERDAYRMAAEQLRAMLDRRWISVEDRLPEELVIVNVLGTGDNPHRHGYDACWLCEGEWASWFVKDVTHWQPLPPAPEAHDES